jgi:hypothetical protein
VVDAEGTGFSFSVSGYYFIQIQQQARHYGPGGVLVLGKFFVSIGLARGE